MSVITLLGYMGSGKSTYGQLLSLKLGIKFIDLDDYIESETKMTVSEIFKEKGENWFREFEKQSLRKLVSGGDVVLSLGGGTPVYFDNMDFVNQHSKSVYLNASVDTLFMYLSKNRSKRPIIKDLTDEELHGFIATHLSKRVDFYNKAEFNVITDFKSIKEIVEEIKYVIK
ncbi:MAG: shikimate kinase [Ichthyobacteriaceae bacterium]|nr:shikimate kinase [Ichthyobacteriaceae bacterium]